MRTTRKLRPQLEIMESKALMSAGLAGPSAAAAVVAPVERTIHLDGTFRGRYNHHRDNHPDAGSTFELFGSGSVHGVGRAFVAGSVHSIGFIAQGHAEGTLFLGGVGGTLTLKLTGPEQDNGPKGLPDVFQYTVVGGTGKYRHVDDSGTASLVVIPGRSRKHPGDPDRGTFTLVLTSNPSPTV